MTAISLCSDEAMQALLKLVDVDEPTGTVRLRELLVSWPNDHRLHFLDGSLKAANRDYVAGALAMRKALDITPDFQLARFQLGFLQLTSGEAFAAQETWGPLHGLPKESYLRIFVDGLCHMIRDEFPEAIALLEQGISLNSEIAPLNRDMELILAELRNQQAPSLSHSSEGEPISAAQMLLQQASFKTKH